MRPVSLFSGDALEQWGVEDLDKLLDHFGKEKKTVWQDDERIEHTSTSPPLVDSAVCRAEFRELKQTVISIVER